ncbi:MAG: type II toxin-antitoxin system Phd/YefM family antitoxin [Bacillota bacterium]
MARKPSGRSSGITGRGDKCLPSEKSQRFRQKANRDNSEILCSRDSEQASHEHPNESQWRFDGPYLGVRDAKANLSWALREVKQGKEVVITEYGTPVARLVPARPLTLEERLAEMEARGEVEPASPPRKSIALPLKIPGDIALKLLEEESMLCPP